MYQIDDFKQKSCVDENGVDEMGEEEVGVDQMGSRRSGTTLFKPTAGQLVCVLSGRKPMAYTYQPV